MRQGPTIFPPNFQEAYMLYLSDALKRLVEVSHEATLSYLPNEASDM
jgi:hypothetical protein